MVGKALRCFRQVAAFACGLQNAMASTYYGLIIRTTHVTGIVTDIGVIIGQRLRGHAIEPWRLGLLVIMLIGFFAGGVLGAIATAKLGHVCLAFAAAASFTGGLTYWIVRHTRHLRVEDAPQLGNDTAPQ